MLVIRSEISRNQEREGSSGEGGGRTEESGEVDLKDLRGGG